MSRVFNKKMIKQKHQTRLDTKNCAAPLLLIKNQDPIYNDLHS